MNGFGGDNLSIPKTSTIKQTAEQKPSEIFILCYVEVNYDLAMHTHARNTEQILWFYTQIDLSIYKMDCSHG